MTAVEFETNKAIAKPPRPIPGLDDDEVIFLTLYLMFCVVFYVIGLGVIPNMLKIKITQELIKTYAFISFIALPLISLTLIKIFKHGKRIGFLEQSLYIFFKSNLPEKIDLRDSNEKNDLKKMIVNPLNMINHEEFYKISKINGEKIERYNNIDTINNVISDSYLNEKKALEMFYHKKNHKARIDKEEYQKILNNYYKFMD